MSASGQNAYYSKFPPGFINGLIAARASNTTLTLATGSARDSTDASNIALSSSATIDFGITGANGIDTGAIAASKMYAVFVIGDSMGKNATAGLVSLSATAPTLPSGYDMFRLVGYWPSNGSSQLAKGYTFGASNTRTFMYDAVTATAVTAGAQTSYTAVDLSNIIPAVDLTPVYTYAALTPATAGNTAKFVPSGQTGDSHILTGNVATKISDSTFKLTSKLISGAPKIDYKVANGSDALAISVEGFDFTV
jgi:hypothetical protein